MYVLLAGYCALFCKARGTKDRFRAHGMGWGEYEDETHGLGLEPGEGGGKGQKVRGRRRGLC